MTHHPTATATFRGGAVGALSAGLTVAAHGVGGGGFPEAAALTLLVVTCAGVGAITASLPARWSGPLALLGALAAGQLAGHVALILTTHVHSTFPAISMSAAHAAATALCALLVATAERLYGSTLHVWRVVSRAVPTPITLVPSLPVPTRHHAPLDALLRASISRRGPPVLV
ncbi:MAG: hypothetical protein WAW17_01525 [Rhodococcus sp. (in: high G+C Gram-positive bacteria)]|uniref:hypothetical protein n=1 Tax=Rhodococcus sp. TaxID=1831 RepID=UPI003BB0F342